MPQEHFKMLFCLDRIVPGQHGGKYEPDNIAYACHLCNRKKGPNLSGLDPDTEKMTRLFNPRIDSWEDHFRFDSFRIIGTSKIGKATAAVLDMNAAEQLRLRKVFAVRD